MGAALAYREATLGTPDWDDHDLVAAADHPADAEATGASRALAYDTRGQQDPSAGNGDTTRSTRVTGRRP